MMKWSTVERKKYWYMFCCFAGSMCQRNVKNALRETGKQNISNVPKNLYVKCVG